MVSFETLLKNIAVYAVRHALPDAFLNRAYETRRRRQFAGDARYCPVCQSGLSSFAPREWFQDAMCPVCFCKDCHRASWLFIEQLSETFSKPVSILHIAPEPHFRRRLSRDTRYHYICGDIAPGKADLVVDIQCMSFADETFDLVYASHVVNVVPDHAAAISELFRVLKPGGMAIPQVPLRTDGVGTTVELASQEARRKRFGDENIFRLFEEADYLRELKHVGFEVFWDHRLEQLSEGDRIRFGLNELKVLLARKPL